jgi:hypothetical protein
MCNFLPFLDSTFKTDWGWSKALEVTAMGKCRETQGCGTAPLVVGLVVIVV